MSDLEWYPLNLYNLSNNVETFFDCKLFYAKYFFMFLKQEMRKAGL